MTYKKFTTIQSVAIILTLLFNIIIHFCYGDEMFINCSLINSTLPAQPRKIYAAGSGLDMLSQPDTISEIIALSGKEKPNVLYIGTATYDAEEEMNIQTKAFTARGCEVTALKITHGDPGINSMCRSVENADILLVSGGNTLFAVDRMVTVGLDQIIKGAGNAGKVLCGGSAGGIVWFENGHSDSGDPVSFLNPNGPLFKNNLTKKQLGSAWNYVKDLILLGLYTLVI